ncbi:4-alpha-glucanotransferase [Thiomicrospira microaerophila]|uniref:4-alpha-glucanotransferase n=1 Tax=Thiomicrospira microaerophila TaxID=406020 RepID=UPI00200C0C72|nr:4-alpha-glucanotransferase [Thiomicrospira microaerophila]UQB41583.1 4-alpha-glucanotransferase [Thiomicrospira microaerophila]
MARSAGVLLHPTSLPSGVLDYQAWVFLDWMQKSGLSIWQMLPLTPPHDDLSPYQSLSAFAMNPRLLPSGWQKQLDAKAFENYQLSPPHWLEDYALFIVLKAEFNGQGWFDWPEAYRYRDAKALADFAKNHKVALTKVKKQQFHLQHIWQQLKSDANAKGIEMFGDMPIFVAYDSADVWANPDQFKLDENLQPTVVTGVPPDYFSETGQRWGNPHYNWKVMQQDGFRWWRLRIEGALEQFDLLRIDHFRGLEASWEIPASEPTAMNGEWVKVPGGALLERLQQEFDPLPLVAEDLGIITPEVVALKNQFDLPGMSVLQFGFSGLPDNPHAPNELTENSVVYTGTHDNDTSLGWFNTLNPDTQNWILSQTRQDVGDMPWPLIATGMDSVAERVIVPMQDFMALNAEHRMNTPGTTENNWRWQFDWDDLPDGLEQRIKNLVVSSQRLAPEKGEA